MTLWPAPHNADEGTVGDEAALLLVALSVPLILGCLFALAFGTSMVVFGPDGGAAMMRHAPLLYTAFLMVPLGILVALGGVTRLGDWVAPRFGTDGYLVALGVALGAVLFRMEVGAASALRRLVRREDLRTAIEGGSSSLGDSGLARPSIIIAMIVISAGEEIIWRGFVLESSQNVWSLAPAMAVGVAAVTFGLNHWYFGVQNIVLKTISGLAWGALAFVSVTLWPVIVSHTTFSLLTIVRLRRQTGEKGGSPGAGDTLRAAI